ncbi:MAG: FAD-binding oxidoreductase [Chloroflexota bacterium]
MIEQITIEKFELTLVEIRALSEKLHGAVYTPGDAEYEAARLVWNADINRHPALIVRPADATGVAAAVTFARENELPLAVRGGGHSLPGYGACDGGVLLDLSALKGIEVDPAARVARVQGGVLGRELGKATLPHGLALPLGQVPATGVAGVLLGGGIGWLTRMYGLSCDHLLSAEVVTADGQIITASASEHPDLFWALRGGGGNFGIVTSMEVKLQPAGMILGGMIIHPMTQAADFLRFYRDFAANAPDELATTLMFVSIPPIPVIPAHLHGQPAVMTGVCYAGDIEEGQKVLAPLRAFGTPLVDMIAPMPFGVLQGMGEAGGELGLRHDIRSGYLQELSDEAIDTIVDSVFEMPRPFSATHIMHLGGAMSRVAPDATAFPARDARFLYNILPIWQDASQADASRSWMNAFDDRLQPFTHGGVYVNFLGDEGPERVRAAYGPNYDWLATVKQQYDPTNLFHINYNIEPMLPGQ